jgi:hypothetical protein
MPDYSEDYLAFYKNYPRQEGKADGQKAWNALTEPMRRAAVVDVAKRVRLGAYPQNKKKIQLPASYLRAARWDDDWEDTLESSRKPDEGLQSRGPVDYVPITDDWTGTKWDSLANRLMLKYVRTAAGLSDHEMQLAKQIKNEASAEYGPALDEDLAAGTAHADAVIDFARLLFKRLDGALGKALTTRILRVRSGT